MKAFERQTVGYSEQALEGIFRETLFPSAFFNQPVPVRGICFATGEESLQLAHHFVETSLNMGMIAFRIVVKTGKRPVHVSNDTSDKAKPCKTPPLPPELDLGLNVFDQPQE